jgi:hypothetical protein
MDKTGLLSIDDAASESRLDGTLLAVENDPEPLGAATTIVENAGLRSGDRATVSPGTNGRVGRVPVVFIVSAQAADQLNLLSKNVGPFVGRAIRAKAAAAPKGNATGASGRSVGSRSKKRAVAKKPTKKRK